MMIAACEFDQRLGVRLQAGKHHMTARQLIKIGKNKKRHPLWHAHVLRSEKKQHFST